MNSFRPAAGTHLDPDADKAPGVSQYHLICGPHVRDATVELLGRWAQDRAVPTSGADRLTLLSSAAIAHGLLFRPRAVTVSLRWVDPDRVRVDLRWHGVAGVAPGSVTQAKLDSTIAIFDAVADNWGFGHGSTTTHWLVLDTAV